MVLRSRGQYVDCAKLPKVLKSFLHYIFKLLNFSKLCEKTKNLEGQFFDFLKTFGKFDPP